MARERVDAELLLDGFASVGDFVETMVSDPGSVKFLQYNPAGDCTVGLIASPKTTEPAFRSDGG